MQIVIMIAVIRIKIPIIITMMIPVEILLEESLDWFELGELLLLLLDSSVVSWYDSVSLKIDDWIILFSSEEISTFLEIHSSVSKL